MPLIAAFPALGKQAAWNEKATRRDSGNIQEHSAHKTRRPFPHSIMADAAMALKALLSSEPPPELR
jgi:hypothetical protein